VLLASRPISKLEDHPLSDVCDCLFNIFAAALHTLAVILNRNLRMHVMPRWRGTLYRTNSFTHSLTHSMEHSPSWKANSHSLFKKFLPFYGTRRFITVSKETRNWSISWARRIQSSTSHPISLRNNLILSTHLHLDLLSGLFPSGFPTEICTHFSCLPCVFHALPKSSSFIWSP